MIIYNYVSTSSTTTTSINLWERHAEDEFYLLYYGGGNSSKGRSRWKIGPKTEQRCKSLINIKGLHECGGGGARDADMDREEEEA